MVQVRERLSTNHFLKRHKWQNNMRFPYLYDMMLEILNDTVLSHN